MIGQCNILIDFGMVEQEMNMYMQRAFNSGGHSISHRHSDVTDAPVKQQGRKVWRSLPWSSPSASSHTGGNPLIWLHIVTAIKGLGSQQLLHRITKGENFWEAES